MIKHNRRAHSLVVEQLLQVHHFTTLKPFKLNLCARERETRERDGHYRNRESGDHRNSNTTICKRLWTWTLLDRTIATTHEDVSFCLVTSSVQIEGNKLEKNVRIMNGILNLFPPDPPLPLFFLMASNFELIYPLAGTSPFQPELRSYFQSKLHIKLLGIRLASHHNKRVFTSRF